MAERTCFNCLYCVCDPCLWLRLMHRVIMQPPEGKVVDHADGNKVDNCRVNLRVCTPGENTHNQRRRCTSSSTYKGVRYSKRLRKWYARCRYQGERYVRGYFDTEMEAARAYDWLAVTLFGEFARLNFPREWPPERRVEAVAHRQELLGKVKVRKPRKVRGTVERGTVARLVTADVRRPTKRASPPPDDPATSEGKKVRKANRRGE